MPQTPIYLSALEIENFRTFGTEASIDLINKNKVLPQWTLLLGDNGIGKSTILQIIAWVKPQFPDQTSPGQNIPLDEIEPLITNEENDTLLNMVNKGNMVNATARIAATFIAKKSLKYNIPKERSQSCRSTVSILTDKEGKLKDVQTTIETRTKKTFYENPILIYAYSASRKLGKLNLNDRSLDDTIPSFIAEQSILFDAEEILHTLRYAELGEKENKKYTAFLLAVKEMLVGLLPDFEKITHIEIKAPKLVNGKLQVSKILITTKHGKSIPFHNFSLGYKTVISWTIDLAWRLFNTYENNPLQQPAIVLIDEIDLHLHPLWQTTIMDNLSKHFPKVQFIATAHSPLMVQAAIDANYAVLKYTDDGVCIINEPEDVEGWRVDQILTSELFGLRTARGPIYEKLLAEREKLANKLKLTQEEKKHLKEITEKLSQHAPGNTPEEMKNRQLISEVVNRIRKSNQKITV